MAMRFCLFISVVGLFLLTTLMWIPRSCRAEIEITEKEIIFGHGGIEIVFERNTHNSSDSDSNSSPRKRQKSKGFVSSTTSTSTITSTGTTTTTAATTTSTTPTTETTEVIDESSESNTTTTTTTNATVNNSSNLDEYGNGISNGKDDTSTNDHHITRIEGIWLFNQFLSKMKVGIMESDDDIVLNFIEKDIPELARDMLLSDKCVADIGTGLNGVRFKELWANAMLDAMGNPDAGILEGNHYFFGNYDECLNIKNFDFGSKFQSQYCVLTFEMQKIKRKRLNKPMDFYLGVCLPDSCKSDVIKMLGDFYLYHDLGEGIYIKGADCTNGENTFSSGSIFAIALCSLLILIVIAATLYECFLVRILQKDTKLNEYSDMKNEPGNNESDEKYVTDEIDHTSEKIPITDGIKYVEMYSATEKHILDVPEKMPHRNAFWEQVLLSFSAWSNTSQLFNTCVGRDDIGCLHGMRFLSMTWVVLFHVYAFATFNSENRDGYLRETYTHWTFAFVIRGSLAVDSFLTISGFLVSHVMFKKLSKYGVSLSMFVNFFSHRYLRLTAPHALVLMIYTTVNDNLIDGPMSGGLDKERLKCHKYWWANLLYVNNFLDVSQQCMNWTWYLAVDMQYYVVSPISFVPMFFYQWIGWIFPALLLIASTICSGLIAGFYHLASEYSYTNWSSDYLETYYYKPYTRIGPYIIGMMTGFLMHKHDGKVNLSSWAVVSGWIAVATVVPLVLYGPVDYMTHQTSMETSASAFYIAVHRSAWGASMSWIIFACANGYGGFVNTFLSWKKLIPLSRLCYCVYLIHVVVVIDYYLSLREAVYLHDFHLSYIFFAVLSMALVLAYVVYIAVELPTLKLEKIIKDRFGKETSTK